MKFTWLTFRVLQHRANNKKDKTILVHWVYLFEILLYHFLVQLLRGQTMPVVQNRTNHCISLKLGPDIQHHAWKSHFRPTNVLNFEVDVQFLAHLQILLFVSAEKEFLQRSQSFCRSLAADLAWIGNFVMKVATQVARLQVFCNMKSQCM